MHSDSEEVIKQKDLIKDYEQYLEDKLKDKLYDLC